MKIKISEKTKEEILYEARRGYQNGCAALCACYLYKAEEAEGFLVVEASRNWSFQSPDCHVLIWLEMTADDLIDTEIPGHPEICSFWEGSNARSEWKELRESDETTQGEIDAFVEKYEGEIGEFYTSDDVDSEVWDRITEELWDSGFEIVVVEDCEKKEAK